MAKEEGVITESSCDDIHILSGCDVVILCAPVDVIKNMQDDLAKVDIGMITDVGSVEGRGLASPCGAQTCGFCKAAGHGCNPSSELCRRSSDGRIGALRICVQQWFAL